MYLTAYCYSHDSMRKITLGHEIRTFPSDARNKKKPAYKALLAINKPKGVVLTQHWAPHSSVRSPLNPSKTSQPALCLSKATFHLSPTKLKEEKGKWRRKKGSSPPKNLREVGFQLYKRGINKTTLPSP